jgi:tRNA-2-methylthio-N6-dimethylallyladenosine synthase
VAVSSDFIVGFCGETEESFQRTCERVSEAGFKNSFIFKYSPRSGTKAFELLADDIPEDIKRRRNAELLNLQNEISEEDNATFIGRRLNVLVEGPSKHAAKGRGDDALPGWHGASGPPLPVANGAAQNHDHDHDDFVPLSVIHTNDRVAGVGASLGETPALHVLSEERAHGVANIADALHSASPVLQLTGRSRCDRIVVFDGNPRLVGTLADIEIDDCTPTTLIGRIVTREIQHGTSGLLPILA